MKKIHTVNNEDKYKDDKRDWKSHGRGRILAGTLILLVGIGLLLNNLFPWFSFDYVWPLLIIAVGLFLIMRRHNER